MVSDTSDNHTAALPTTLHSCSTGSGPWLLARALVLARARRANHHRPTLALNIKNLEVERLAAEVAGLTGESRAEAIRQALLERRRRLSRA